MSLKHYPRSEIYGVNIFSRTQSYMNAGVCACTMGQWDAMLITPLHSSRKQNFADALLEYCIMKPLILSETFNFLMQVALPRIPLHGRGWHGREGERLDIERRELLGVSCQHARFRVFIDLWRLTTCSPFSCFRSLPRQKSSGAWTRAAPRTKGV